MQEMSPIPERSIVDWAHSSGLTGYQTSVFLMEQRVGQIARNGSPELVWLVEHPPIYTAGTSTVSSDLLAPARFPVHATGRGGELTYHGPGQRVVYVMLDVRKRFGSNVRAYVEALENWGIATLRELGVAGHIRPGRVGIWVEQATAPGGEAKIAALGVRIRSGIGYHGMSINVAPDLEHFSGIVPCGIREFGVTSLADLGSGAGMKDVDNALRAVFERDFAPARTVADPVLLLPSGIEPGFSKSGL